MAAAVSDDEKAGRPRGKARAHSRLVLVLRWVLPMTMIGVVASLISLVSLHAIHRQEAAQNEATTPIRMVNPHFYGRDSKGRAYTLSAREAARDQSATQRVLLNHPSITLDLENPHPSLLTADDGVYHEDTRVLYLKGHVRGSDPKTASFATDQAMVNTQTGEIKGLSPLAGQAKAGELNANSFDVYDKGDRVVFKGGVHARLKQR